MLRRLHLRRPATACALAATTLLGCAPTAARMPESERLRADDYARRGQEAFDAGDRERGLLLATHALVVRLAACAYECPDVAYSFVELGDMRFARGEVGHAAQSYRRALEVLEPHAATHRQWILATRERLALACGKLGGATAACSLSARSPRAK